MIPGFRMASGTWSSFATHETKSVEDFHIATCSYIVLKYISGVLLLRMNLSSTSVYTPYTPVSITGVYVPAEHASSVNTLYILQYCNYH